MSLLCLYGFYIVWFCFIAGFELTAPPRRLKQTWGKQCTDSSYRACNVIVVETDVKWMELKCLLHLLLYICIRCIPLDDALERNFGVSLSALWPPCLNERWTDVVMMMMWDWQRLFISYGLFKWQIFSGMTKKFW